MTPEAHTMYSLFLLTALAALQHWLNRRHRVTRNVREGVRVTVTSAEDSTGGKR